jgi:hypothetical protein
MPDSSWVRTEDQLPPEEELILGDNGSEVFLVTFCGDHWRYAWYESRLGPVFWCKIPERGKD